MAAVVPVAGIPSSVGSRSAESRTSPPPALGRRPRGATRPGAQRLRLTVSADIALAALVAYSLLAVGTGTFELSFSLVLGWPVLLLLCGAYGGPSPHTSRRRQIGVLRAGAVLGLTCWSLPTLVDVTAAPGELVMATARR